jgi:hypothetical protein
MNGRFEDYSYRGDSLPPLPSWISRGCGLACFAAAGFLATVTWRDPSVAGVAGFAACTVAGALLLVLPDYLRYVGALRESPPLPAEIEDAFARVYGDLAEMGDALRKIAARTEERTAPGPGDEWTEEVEEALVHLRLDCDRALDRLAALAPEEGHSAPRPLPEGMLSKALSQAGKGKGFPIEE